MDAIIATSVNSSLKACAAGFARSATECSSPHLRNLMAKASQDAIRRQDAADGPDGAAGLVRAARGASGGYRSES